MTFDREQDYGFDGYATSVVEAADDFGFLTPADEPGGGSGPPLGR
jgi:hypothetical protein